MKKSLIAFISTMLMLVLFSDALLAQQSVNTYQETKSNTVVGSIESLLSVAAPGDGIVYTIESEVYLVFHSTFRNRKVIVDDSGGIVIDDPNGVISTDYNRYDGFTGLTGTIQEFMGLTQFVPEEPAGPATSSGNIVEPQPKTITDITHNTQGELVIIGNVMFQETGLFNDQTNYMIHDSNGNVLRVRTDRITESILEDGENTYLNTPIPEGPVNLAGYITVFNQPQLVIRKLEDIFILDQTPDGNDVTFRVDMNHYKDLGIYQPESGHNVYVRGDFNSWMQQDQMVDLNDNGIYEFTRFVDGEPGMSQEYKFYFSTPEGGEWEDFVGPDGMGNRVFTLSGSPQILPVVYFNNEPGEVGEIVINPPADPSMLDDLPLSFNVDTNDINWAGYPMFPFEGAELARVANPDQSGINETSFVIEYEKVAGSMPWAGFFYHIEGSVIIEDDTAFRLKVWSPRAGVNAMLKLENRQNPDINTGDLFVPINAANEWVELEWNLSNVPREFGYDRVVFIMDLQGDQSDGGSDYTWYLDDFEFTDSEIVDPPPPDGNDVTFSVNMNVFRDLDIYIPEIGDEIYLKGSFNDWSIQDQMFDNNGNGIYDLTLFLEGEPGTMHEYKFFILAGDGRDLPNGGWETDVVGDDSTWNRSLSLTGSPQILPTVFFDNNEGDIPPPVVDYVIDLNVSDEANNLITLIMGTAPDATTGFDPQYDEYAPPAPPEGAFDARIRFGGEAYFTFFQPTIVEETQWNVRFAPQSGFGPITLSWDPSVLPEEGVFYLRDIVNGSFVNVDMSQQSSLVISQSFITELSLTHTLVTDIEIPRNYAAGWNMVGLPVEADHQNFQEIFTGSLANTLFRFNGAYQSAQTLDHGTGYWLRYGSAATEIFVGAAVNEVTVNMTPGWNLISGPSMASAIGSVNDPSGIIISGTLFGFNGAYVNESILEPGRGYWLRANASGAVTFNGATTTQLASETTYSFDNHHRITVNSGDISRDLYFGDDKPKNTVIEQFSLPPLPPQGAFDVRFSGGWWLSENDIVVLELQQSDEPVTITIEGNGTYHVTQLKGLVELSNTVVSGGELITLASQTDRINVVLTGDAETSLPTEFALMQNYPNPFNPVTMIRYSVSETVHVRIDIYNIAGQKVSTVVNSTQDAGYHTVAFDASRLASGIYLYKMQAGDFVKVQKMMFVK